MATVLLVDDDADTREMFCTVLRLAGHVVLEAATGPEAVRRALADRPDCVVMDIGLPGLDGYQVAAAIREADPTGRIGLAAVTGHGDDDARARSRRAGFDVHLVKPLEPAVLTQTVARLVAPRP